MTTLSAGTFPGTLDQQPSRAHRSAGGNPGPVVVQWVAHCKPQTFTFKKTPHGKVVVRFTGKDTFVYYVDKEGLVSVERLIHRSFFGKMTKAEAKAWAFDVTYRRIAK